MNNEAFREHLVNEARKELAKVDYSEYCKYVHKGKWYLGNHLKLVCDNVEALLDRSIEEDILIISMPPQHGKSQCVSETLPSYVLAKNPNANIIELSYGDDLANRFGRKNKLKIDEFGKELFGVELDRSSDGLITIKGGTGAIITKGIMAGVTGNPGDLIIVDDPVKNRQEADSESYRDRVWEEFLASVNTRLSARGVVIVIMTRWHEDDLAGRLIKEMPERCKVLNIPLEAEDNDILGRNVGDALFPEIGKDNKWLQKFKKAYTTKEGSRTWNALMQGRPTSAEGNIFKREWWNFYDNIPKLPLYIMVVDATFKKTEDSDFVGIGVWGKKNNEYFLVDVMKKRMGFVETINAVRHMKIKHPYVGGIYIEDKANGSAIIEVLRKSINGVIAFNPGRDSKESRASAISPIVEAGQVFLPKYHELTGEFIEECSAFPNGMNDDLVDVLSMGLNLLMRRHAAFEQSNDYDPAYGTPYDNEHEEMLYNMTGLSINQEMFEWGDFK